jgi:hypothetical protein
LALQARGLAICGLVHASVALLAIWLRNSRLGAPCRARFAIVLRCAAKNVAVPPGRAANTECVAIAALELAFGTLFAFFLT